MDSKAALRKRLKAARRAHAASLPDGIRALLFLRPPRAISETIPAGTIIGVYAATPEEAPASAYARWFFEAGHAVALPWFAARDAAMTFRQWENPHSTADLEKGPWGVLQLPASAPEAEPGLVFVPLVGFTASGARLGMGAGHYDRWLAEHPQARAIGLGWDCQETPLLPLEPHDRALDAVITPTRLLGPFERGANAMRPAS